MEVKTMIKSPENIDKLCSEAAAAAEADLSWSCMGLYRLPPPPPTHINFSSLFLSSLSAVRSEYVRTFIVLSPET